MLAPHQTKSSKKASEWPNETEKPIPQRLLKRESNKVITCLKRLNPIKTYVKDLFLDTDALMASERRTKLTRNLDL